MAAKTKIRYAVLIVLMALASIQAVAEEKKETQNKPAKKQELKFRVQTRTQKEFSNMARLAQEVRPTHIAVFYVSNLPRFEKPYRGRGSSRIQSVANASGDWSKNIIDKRINTGTSEWPNDLLASKAAKNLTENHKILISKGVAVTINNASPAEFKIYARNESDAEYTAKAIIEVLNGYAETARNELKRKANDWQKELVNLEKRTDELKKEQKEVTESLEETKRRAHYLSLDEAKERIKELNVYLDMERIQMAGAEAGIKAVKEYLEKAKKGGGTKELEKADALEAKMIDQMIELATVKAKYEAAEATREWAEGFISLTNRLEKLKKTIPEVPKQINTVKKYLGTAKALLLIPTADLFTPKIEPAIVTIFTQEKTSL